jgi:hypothetical protein
MTSQTDSQKSRRRLLFGSLALLLVVGIVGGVATLATDSIRHFVSRFQVADYSGEPGAPTYIVIEAGEDGAAVARKMVEADIIGSSPCLWRWRSLLAWPANRRLACAGSAITYCRPGESGTGL